MYVFNESVIPKSFLSTYYSKSTTFIKIDNKPYNYSNIDFSLYSFHHIKEPSYDPSAYIKSELKIGNKFELVDLVSIKKKQGYAKTLLIQMLYTIIIINKEYKVNYIYGFISPEDINYWDYSIHTYKNLNGYAYECNLPISVDFRLANGVTTDYFLSHKDEYRNDGIRMRMYLSYP